MPYLLLSPTGLGSLPPGFVTPFGSWTPDSSGRHAPEPAEKFPPDALTHPDSKESVGADGSCIVRSRGTPPKPWAETCMLESNTRLADAICGTANASEPAMANHNVRLRCMGVPFRVVAPG